MVRWSGWLGVSALLVAGTVGVSNVGAQDAPPVANEGPWRMVLESQIKTEKGCDLHEVLMFQEIPLGGETGIEGRVSCRDGREFDFSRNRAHQKFRIELCAPAVC